MITSPSPRLKKNSLPKFETEKYSHLPATDLVVFAVHILNEQQVVISLENVVSACFLLFPHKFALKNYVKWPDSAAVQRRWADARAKGLISGTPEEGYRITFKGARVAEKAAKALGVFKEKPKQKKTKPAAKPVKARSAPKTAKVEKKAPAKVKLVSKPAVKKQASVKLKPIVQQSTKTGRKPVKPQIAKKAASKPKVKPQPNASAAAQAPVKPIKPKVRVEAVKVQSTPKSKRTVAPMKQSAAAQPAKQKKNQLPARQILKEAPPAPLPAKPAPAAVPAVGKEEKERAAKFVKSMERSDAYRLYKSKGKRAEISEFDFRSLLLCTMESSAETLARNLNTFKGYASIQSRKDLTIFLDHCEEKFAPLLKPGGKKKK